MKEHNNRKKANKFAEYITGIELRKYTAEKVKKYREVKYLELIQCADAPIYVRPEEDSED